MQCKICSGSSDSFGELLVLSKHNVQFFRCTGCGFIQTEEPHWLEEAYSAAIARQDVGIMFRNEQNAAITSAVLRFLLPGTRTALDFGGGHGVFVRMMRDRGYDFHWRDLYASNDFARGFEFNPAGRYDFLTAFEVLEHFVDPIPEFERIMQLSPNIFVSTYLVPEPTPALNSWWYFSPSTGQHISFFTPKALAAVAARFNRHLLSHGPYHLFTEKPASPSLFRLAVSAKFARLAQRITRRPSLIETDYEQLAHRPLR